MDSKKSCDKCKKNTEKLKKCGACKKVEYCSRECQKSDWENHKKICSFSPKNKISAKISQREKIIDKFVKEEKIKKFNFKIEAMRKSKKLLNDVIDEIEISLEDEDPFMIKVGNAFMRVDQEKALEFSNTKIQYLENRLNHFESKISEIQ
ncbi:hypothetical protein MHBO_003266 [Bonamia ostreae]|uniref:MYND-type domain-containing protein n=1 Tax=Bonamia ostreae TaxID=126728 RepID=A0ABV2APX8_9EUKA